MTYGDILRDHEKQYITERYSHLKAKIRLVQQCAAISSTAELLLQTYLPVVIK